MIPALSNAADSSCFLLNVYDSALPWPAGTKIKALRLVQLLPKSTPILNQPAIGMGFAGNAKAVLGTVPVEEDGSASFYAPAGVTLQFQALDQRGLAVQMMRSGTYLHPGERLACQGCHESKEGAPPQRRAIPLAGRRAPSRITPEAAGSNPINYPRLVQPVLIATASIVMFA